MKLSTLMLADHAEIREGTLAVLSGYINQLQRDSYPSLLRVYFVAVTEADSEEIRIGTVNSQFEFWCERRGQTEAILRGSGSVEAHLSGSRGGYFPMVFDLSLVEVPEPGEYVLWFSIDGLKAGSYTFYADTAPAMEASGRS